MQSVLISCIRYYQRYISRWTPATCRFQPTCSEYAAQSIARHGAMRGLGLAFARLCRCHPFHVGGYDPVK